MTKIEINKVKKKLGVFSLDIPELIIEKNDSILLLGNNGSGKTTLLKLILDLILPDQGQIFMDGKILNLDENWKLSTGAYLDHTFLVPYLTAIEYLQMIVNFKIGKDFKVKEILYDYNKFFNVDYFDKFLIRELSTGNQQKVGIISALITKPNLLILDEPSSGLDPISQENFNEMILSYLKYNECAVIMSSHNINDLDVFTNRILLLENGKIKLDSNNDPSSKAVVKQYFNNQ